MNASEGERSHTITAEAQGRVLARALREGALEPGVDTAAVFYDLDDLERRVRALQAAFPPESLHAVAIKANPLVAVLRRLGVWGCGLEAASWPEVALARAAGVKPARIVYDSPAKTRAELEQALRAGIYINADSLAELERLDELITAQPGPSRIGLRLNPQVGEGAIAYTSTATVRSKFGEPLGEREAQIRQAFLRYAWLRGVHVHVGSQGYPMTRLIDGIRRVLDFALSVNADAPAEEPRVTTIDVGGGLAVALTGEQEAEGIPAYAERLRMACPELFGGRFQLITEFGRALYTHAGWIAARVEYVKEAPGLRIAILHAGADLLLRECYLPEDWRRDVAVCDARGWLKGGTGPQAQALEPTLLAGPLCFSGDTLGGPRRLPRIEAGDYVIVRDTGAYTLGMWSRYNSRQMPRVIGYAGPQGAFCELKARESVDDVVRFWE